MTLPHRDGRGRTASRPDTGGIATVFLTLSLLVLVMALGFVFGRVVIARAYIKGASEILKQPQAKPPGGQVEAPANTVFPPPREAETGMLTQQDQAQHIHGLTPEASESAANGSEAASQSEAEEQQDLLPDTAGAARGDVRYAVQVGIFGSEESARDTLSQLTRAGHAARIEVDRQAPHTMYRVLTGSYRREEDARKALEQLQAEGFTEAFVVERQ